MTAHPLRALAPHGHITPAAFAHCQLPRSLAGDAPEDGAAGASCSRWAEVAGRMRRHVHLAQARPLLDVHVAMALAAARAPAEELQRHLQAMGEAGAEAAVPAGLGWEPLSVPPADYAPLSVGPGNADRRGGGIAAVAAGLSREPDCRWVYAAVAVPVARGMAAFAGGDWEAAVDALLPAR